MYLPDLCMENIREGVFWQAGLISIVDLDCSPPKSVHKGVGAWKTMYLSDLWEVSIKKEVLTSSMFTLWRINPRLKQ